MTEFTGSILELNKKKALVMTDACDFVYIQRRPEMIIGQQIKFSKSEINKANKNYIRYISLIASVFIIALCSVFYMQVFVPSNVFAYIDIDINPSIEFAIDKNAIVLDTKPLNKDAQTLLKELELVDLPLKEAIAEVVETSKQLGFISTNKNNAVLISASVDADIKSSQNDSNQKTLDNILSSIGNETFNVGTDDIKPEILKVTPENRKSAIKNDISMGRYALYSKIKKDNKDITVEKAKTERVSDMLDEAKSKNKNSDKDESSESDSYFDSDSDSKASNADNKNSDENQIDKSSENNSSNSNSSDNRGVAENSKFNQDFTNNRKNNNDSAENFPRHPNTSQDDKINDKAKKNNIYNNPSLTDKPKVSDEKNRNDAKNTNQDEDEEEDDKTDENNKSNKK